MLVLLRFVFGLGLFFWDYGGLLLGVSRCLQVEAPHLQIWEQAFTGPSIRFGPRP